MSRIAEVALAAINDFIDKLLHPRGSASHLGSDEDIFPPRLVVLRALEYFRTANLWRPANPFILENRAWWLFSDCKSPALLRAA